MGIQNWSENVILVNLAEEPQMSEELQTVMEIIRDRVDCDVVIDFSGVAIVTSSSIAKLLKILKTLNSCDRRMIFSGVGVKTRQIFDLTGLNTVFEFVDDQFIALASLQLVN